MGMDALVLAAIMVAIAAVAMGIGYGLIYRKIMKGTRKISWKQFIWWGLFVGYMLVVLAATIGRGSYGASMRPKLVPFSSYREAWNEFSPILWRNLFINICLFVPFGFLLPLGKKRFRAWHRTVGLGFLISLAIELVQFVTARGVFETDDLINNVTGTMIGFGFFRLAEVMYSLVSGWKRSRSPKADECGVHDERRAVRVLLAQLPLVVVLVSFAAVFALYDRQELGNLSCSPSERVSMRHVEITCNAVLSDAEQLAMVYKVPKLSVEETRARAEEFFDRFGKGIDEQRTELYEDTAVYWSDDNLLTIWINYVGEGEECTSWLSDRNAGVCEGASEDKVREALKTYGFTVPEDAVFEENGNGNYVFSVDQWFTDGMIYDGTVKCNLLGDCEVRRIRNSVIGGQPYKEFPVISEQEAYERLTKGKFRGEYLRDLRELTVESVEMVYRVDSKGFYQPVYSFAVQINGSPTCVEIPAI